MTYKLDPKDPDSLIDYNIDWSKWLGSIGSDIITSSSWIVPVGITRTNDTFSGDLTTIWLSGGTLGATYTITNRITTLNGRTQDQSIKIEIKNL